MSSAARMFFVPLLSLMGLLGCGGPTPPPPPFPPTPGAVLVNMIPATLSGETFQDSEPFLAVDPNNPNRMAASAFTPNPAGLNSPTAPIYVSQDGGQTWTLNVIVPSQGITGDITSSLAQSANLYAGILRRPGSLLLDELVTGQFTAPVTMTVQGSRTSVDQPFVVSTTVGSNDRLYIGQNDFAAQPAGRTATVDVSPDGGVTFRSVRIETRNTAGQNGPSIRPAFSNDGTVYAAYFGWRARSAGNLNTSDVVVVRDDNGAIGADPFTDLTGSDGQPGVRVVQGVQIPFSNSSTLGQERIGSTLSLAVHPNDSAIVYVAWADRAGTGDIYTIHVRSSTDGGVNWSNDLRTMTDATCVSLAIPQNGTVGVLYQQVVNGRWQTRLEQTRDSFATRQDTVWANTPANSPTVTFLPYIGDYNYLLAVGNQFRGVFSANNRPQMSNFPQGVQYQRAADFQNGQLLDGSGGTVAVSIDPFYFQVPVLN